MEVEKAKYKQRVESDAKNAGIINKGGHLNATGVLQEGVANAAYSVADLGGSGVKAVGAHGTPGFQAPIKIGTLGAQAIKGGFAKTDVTEGVANAAHSVADAASTTLDKNNSNYTQMIKDEAAQDGNHISR